MKNKNNLIIIILICCLSTVLILTLLNKDALQEKKNLNENAIFTIIEDGQEVAQFNMEEIRKIGETNFYANLKSNGKEPVKYEYTGVLLKDILKEANVDLSNKKSATVSAIDGYVVAVSIGKLLDDDNVYIAYKREGESLGTKEDGGNGPYQMIIRKDQFSQYWVKYAYSVELK